MAEKTTSDKKIVKTAPVEVSPLSTLPRGLDEGGYRVAGGDEASEESFTLLDSPPAEYAPGTGYLLDTPTDISIKSQTLRFAPDGTMVVDVVISIGPVKGATDYEVRVALA